MERSRARFGWLFSCATLLPVTLGLIAEKAWAGSNEQVEETTSAPSEDIFPRLAAKVEGQETDEEEGQVEQASLNEATQPANQPATPALPDVNVIAEPPIAPPTVNYSPYVAPRIVTSNPFIAPPVTGYNAPTSNVGTWFNAPNVLFPGTINSVGRDVLRDQQVLNMDDVLRDVAGAVKSYGADGTLRADQFFMRGFEVTSQNWRK